MFRAWRRHRKRRTVQLPNVNGVTLSRVVDFLEAAWDTTCSMAAKAARMSAGLRTKQRIVAEAEESLAAAEAAEQGLAAAAAKARRLADEAEERAGAARLEAQRRAADVAAARRSAEQVAGEAAAAAEEVAAREGRERRTLGSSDKAPFSQREREFVSQLECATLLEILQVIAPCFRSATGLRP